MLKSSENPSCDMPFKERLKSGQPRKGPKPSYVPQNWSEYNHSLRKRGMVSLYLPKGDLRIAADQRSVLSKRPVGPRVCIYLRLRELAVYAVPHVSVWPAGIRGIHARLLACAQNRVAGPQLWASIGPVC